MAGHRYLKRLDATSDHLFDQLEVLSVSQRFELEAGRDLFKQGRQETAVIAICTILVAGTGSAVAQDKHHVVGVEGGLLHGHGVGLVPEVNDFVLDQAEHFSLVRHVGGTVHVAEELHMDDAAAQLVEVFAAGYPELGENLAQIDICLLYTSPSPRD